MQAQLTFWLCQNVTAAEEVQLLEEVELLVLGGGRSELIGSQQIKVTRKGIAMLFTTRIKFVLSDNQKEGIPGVKVSLFDRDIQDDDDFLDTGITDANGEILFRFDSEQYMDVEDQPSWQKESLPDLYIVAYDASGKQVFSTRTEAAQDKLIRVATFPFTREQALEYGWIFE